MQSLGYKFKYIFEIEVFGTKGKIKISDNGKKIELFKFSKSKNFTNYFELKKVKIRDKFNIKRSNDPIKELIEKSILAYSKKISVNPNIFDGYQNLLIAKKMEKSAKFYKIIKV